MHFVLMGCDAVCSVMLIVQENPNRCEPTHFRHCHCENLSEGAIMHLQI